MPSKSAMKKHVSFANAVRCPTASTSKARVAGTGFVALNTGTSLRQKLQLQDLVGEGSKYQFKLQKWVSGSVNALPALILMPC